MRKVLLLLTASFLSKILFSQTYLVPFSGNDTAITCSGTVYDHAGTSSYSNSAYGTLTIYPQTSGSYVSLNFISFQVESGWDYLSIYDGTSTASPLIGSYSISPGTVYATNSAGALTLLFYSDGSVTYSGFEATISCVTSIPLSDLVIQTPAVGSSSVAAGSSLSYTYTAKNQGGANAATSYTGFYLSSNNTWDISDTYLSNQSVSSLAAGGTSYKSGSVTIPSSTPVGNYYLLFYADYNNSVNEENDSNNVSAVPVAVVSAMVDLYISSPSVSPVTVAAGGSASVTGYEYNQGNSTVTSNSIGFYLSSDMTWDVSDVYLSYVTASSITAGSYYYFSQTCTIPSSTAQGNYYILFFADYTNSISETNENNNVNIRSITVTSAQKDLSVVTSSATPPTIAYGSNSTVSFSVLNQSYQATSTSVGFYLSADSAWDVSDTYLSYYTLGTISANSFYSTSTTVTIPSSTTPGNYYILSYVDYTGAIPETNETNNVKAVPVIITSPVIDLLIQTPYLSPASTSPGSSVSVSCYIYNQGTSSSTSSNVGYYLSSDNVFDAGDVYLNYSSGTTLAAGSSSYKSSTLVIPSSTTPGNYYILYFADYTNSVSESVETNNVNYLAITIAASFIDLSILNQYNPASTTAGSTISISCYIVNNGNSSASSSNVGYYLSTDNFFDAGDTYLGYSSGTTLAAGSSSYKSSSVTIPSSTTSGTYYILYFADYTSAVNESNENNNVSSLTIIIGGGTTYTVPLSGTNSATTCSGVIYDNGGSASNYSNNSSGTFTIYPQTTGDYIGLLFTSFSTQSGYDYLYIYNGTSSSDPLLGSYSGSTSPGTVYATGSSGALTLVFMSNSSTTYSGFAANITCVSSIPSPDLYIQNNLTISSSSVVAGASVTATCYIANQGGSSASTSNVGYYLSTDNLWDASDTYLNYSSGATLNAGASSYKSTTLTIPSSTTPGSYYILYFADYSNQVTESVETNNVNLLGITVNSPSVDLVINTPALGSSSLTAGSSVSATCYIYNNGNAAASSSNVGYYLSTDTAWDASDTYLNYSSGTTLSAGSSSYKSSTLTIPSSTTPGNYYILYFADYSNSVAESIESNNVRYLPVIVSAAYIDLSMVNYYLSSSTVAQGGAVTANCYILNQGNTSVTSSNVGFYLSTDSLWDAGDVYLSYQYGGSLNANTYSSRGLSLTIPGSTAAGNYFILYFADYSNMVTENNENNNVVFSPVSVVVPVVDLTMLSPAAYPSSIVAGNSISFSSTIFNTGNSAATNSNVGYYLSTDTVFDASDTYLNYSSGSSLGGGSGAQKSATAVIPTSVAAGNYYILFFADYSYMVTESNENNNVKYYAVTVVSPVVDLFIQTPSLSVSSVVPGGAFTSYCYIYNQGNSSVSSSNVGYYLSADTLWDAGDTYLSYSYGGTLAANSSSYKSQSQTMPSSTPVGSYYILFFADYSNNVPEATETNNVSYVAINVANPFIDLIIQSTTLSPTSVTAGSSVSLSCYIYNQGNSSASSSNVGYYLSADTLWDASDTYLSYSTGTTLAGGASSYKSSTPAIPSATTPGSYYILYYADYSGSVTESNESNNVSYRALTVTAPNIDLIIQTPSLSPTSVAAGGSTTASCYIYNQGTTTASISSVGFYLSTNNTWDASDVFLNYQSGGTLTAGSSSYRSGNLTIPSSTTPGSYYILYFADYLNAETETVETNNVSYAVITVSTPNIDLVIQSPYSPATGSAGGQISPYCYIYNQGNTSAATSNVGYYLSANTVYDVSDVYLGSTTGSSLTAGTSSYRSSTITIPSSTLPGSYYIIFYADYSNVETESNENNNTNYDNITIYTPSIDLVIQSPYSPATATAGNSISVNCYIYNQGTTSSSSSNVGYYLSSDATWDAGDTYLNYSTGGSLASGSSSYKGATVTIPSSTLPGSYYILFYADYSSVESETNENNNVNYAAITITVPSIDLVIQTPYLSSTVASPGGSVSASCYIYNQGSVSAAYSYVGYYLSTDATWDAGDTYLTYSYGGSLGGGTSGYRSATLSIPSSTTQGNYYILYYADYVDYENETNENNNVNYLAITIVTPSVDLIIQSPYAPPSSSPGSSFSASCYVYNQGTTSSTSSNVGFYLSSDTIFDAGDTYLSYSYNGALAAGSSSYESATLTIPGSVPYGNYYILFFADYDNLASETNETNNVSYSPIVIAASFIDLVILSPYSPSTAIAGNSISADCYIYNQGNISSSYSSVGYYFSTDTLWDAGDTYLSYSYGGSLSAGSSGYRSATLPIPGSALPGNYYILFYADYDYLASESIETNNVSYVPVTIVPSGADLVVISPTLSPAAVQAGNTVFVSDYIYNQGNVNSTSSNVGYYLSADSAWDAGDIFLDYSYGGSLSWGISSYRSATLTIPANTLTGNYYILYFADYSLLVNESVETNNINYLPLAVTGLYITLPASGTLNVTICSDTVYDDGGPTANYSNSSNGSLTIYPISSGDKVSLNFTDFSLENGWDYLYIYDGSDTSATLLGSYTGSAGPGTISASNANPAGALTLRLVSDGSINSTGFAAVISCFTPAAYPDLSILSNTSVTPSLVAPGGSISVSCEIANLGNAQASSSSIGFYLSPDTVYNGTDVFISYYNVTPLTSGASNNVLTNLVIPSNTVIGNYYVLFYADFTTLISESDENNNVFYAPLTVDTATIVDHAPGTSGWGYEVYPNPNKGKFEIQVINKNTSEDYKVEIVNILGEKIYSAILPAVQTKQIVDLSHCRAGVYFVRIMSEDGTAIRKIVVE